MRKVVRNKEKKEEGEKGVRSKEKREEGEMYKYGYT